MHFCFLIIVHHTTKPVRDKTYRYHYSSNAVLHFHILTCWYLHKGENEKASEAWHLRRHLPFLFLLIYISLSSRCTTAYKAYCATLNHPLRFRRSYFRRQEPPHTYDARDPSSERWNCERECWPVILPKCRLPRYI
jgi:hypothetical protein